MRAFIAGATGYTGLALVELLAGRGDAVCAHVRPDSGLLAEWRARFRRRGAEVDTSPWEPAAMEAVLLRFQPSHVFALLGTTRKRMRAVGREAAHYDAVDYGLTALLLRATQSATPHARFIYLSAFGAREGGNAYLRARGRIERELRESSISWISARPLFVSGDDREEARPAERLMARALDGVLYGLARFGVRGPAEQYASLTGAELARALSALAESAADGVYQGAALRRLAASRR